MTKYVLISLWNKICDVFATKQELSNIVENKQDRLTAGIGIRIEGNTIINQAIPTTEKEEIVQVAISFENSEELQELYNLKLNVYFNDAVNPSEQIIIDEGGMCSFTVPYGYKYRIEFPILHGYKQIEDEEHIATVIERSIEVKYEHQQLYYEHVVILLGYKVGQSKTAFTNQEFLINIDGQEKQLVTDSSGIVRINIPYGKSYTITVPTLTGYYIDASQQTFQASQKARRIYFTYKRYDTLGLFIVDKNNLYELSLNAWRAAVQANILQNEDSEYILIKTNDFILHNSICYIELNQLSEQTFRSYGRRIFWNSGLCPRSVIIPPNNAFPNGTNCDTYYDGYRTNLLLQQEGLERNISTPLIDYFLSLKKEFGYDLLQGFVPSLNQGNIIYSSNIEEVQDILDEVRPNATYTIGSTTNFAFRSSTVKSYNTKQNLDYAIFPSFPLNMYGTSAGESGIATKATTGTYGITSYHYTIPFYKLVYEDLSELTTPRYIINNGVKVLCNEDGNIATLFDTDSQNNVTWKAIAWDSNGLYNITQNDNDWQDILDLIATNGKCWFISGGSEKFIVGSDEYVWENGDWDTPIIEFTSNTLYRKLETDTWILCNSNGEELITEDSETGDTYYYTCDDAFISNQFRWDKTLLTTTLPSGTSGISIPDGIVSGKVTISGTDYQVDSPKRNIIYNLGN